MIIKSYVEQCLFCHMSENMELIKHVKFSNKDLRVFVVKGMKIYHTVHCYRILLSNISKSVCFFVHNWTSDLMRTAVIFNNN